jgi:enterochelin esterase-like enzyme
MGVLVTAACIVVCAAAAVASQALRQRAETRPGSLDERLLAFQSEAVRGRIHLVVLLPHGYARSGLRYSVVYFLHGLPAASGSYQDVGFLRRALAEIGRPVILVAPQGARDHDHDPEYLDWGPGRNWETAVSKELPAFVDSHFRTIRNRRGRGLVGLSAGGYGAVLLGLHHLDDFSVIESWSGYFHPTDATGGSALDLRSSRRNRRASAHVFVGSLRRAFAARPTFFAFYVGRGDARFRDENLRLHRELVAARVPHVFELYPGGHARTVWSRRARRWLGLAVAHLSRADPQA